MKKLLKDPDFIGWMMWLGLSILLAPLCVHLMFKYTYDTASPVTRYIVGIFAAAMLSGVISMGVNDLWYRIKRRRGAAKRKEGKKAAKSRAR